MVDLSNLTQKKITILGVGVPVVLIGGVAAWFIFFRRRRASRIIKEFR